MIISEIKTQDTIFQDYRMFRNIPLRHTPNLRSFLKSQLQTLRSYLGPPVKSYHGLRTPLALLWARSPPQTKVFGGLALLGLAIANLHPNTIITLGPPLGVGAWFARSRYERTEYFRLVRQIQPSSPEEFEDSDQRIRIARYNEEDVNLVLEGFDNQFQYFKKQVLDLVEKRIVDYIAMSESTPHTMSKVIKPLIDENKQVTVHLGSDVETFVTTKAEVPAFSDDTIVEFTKLSVPYYNSNNAQRRKRLGIVEVSLLEIPQEMAQFQDFRIGVKLVQYKQWGAASEYIGVLPGLDVQKSLFCK